jgi:serine/threonine protein kinase
VWSFGVILSELLSRRKPYYGKITNEVSGIIESVAVVVHDGKKRRANRSDDKDVMPFHEDQLLGQPPKQLLDLMRRCLSLTISARPSFRYDDFANQPAR